MKYILPLFLSVCVSVPATAAFTDFSDLTPGDSYYDGESFVSNGINFHVEAPTSPRVGRIGVGEGISQSPVITTPFLGFGGAGATLEVEIPANTNFLSFGYVTGDIAYPEILTLNGESTPEAFSSLSGWDGLSTGGIEIEVIILQSQFEELGILVLRGPLQTLQLQGYEFFLDNLAIGIPEPSTAVLLFLGVAVLAWPVRSRLYA